MKKQQLHKHLLCSTVHITAGIDKLRIRQVLVDLLFFAGHFCGMLTVPQTNIDTHRCKLKDSICFTPRAKTYNLFNKKLQL